jgi:hypothetical protein
VIAAAFVRSLAVMEIVLAAGDRNRSAVRFRSGTNAAVGSEFSILLGSKLPRVRDREQIGVQGVTRSDETVVAMQPMH